MFWSSIGERKFFCFEYREGIINNLGKSFFVLFVSWFNEYINLYNFTRNLVSYFFHV